MPAESDHLQRFIRSARMIRWNDDDLTPCRLDPGLARILHVATLLEHDTEITVRQARSFALDRDPDLCEFLPQWDREEAEHGRALSCLLEHQSYESPKAAPQRIALRRQVIARVPAGVIGRLPSAAFLFCVLGAAAEYVATATYMELAKRAEQPAVANLMREIARQEARHFAFFLAAARVHGQRMSAIQGRASSRVLKSLWEPIGVPSLGRPLWMALFADWLADADFRRRLEMMDRVVRDLPHLARTTLMADFLQDVSAPDPL